MELKGNVFNVIFRNADNGYSVVELSSNGRLITAVGKFPPVTEGQDLVLEGSYTVNPQFGQQFSATDIKIAPPTSKESIMRYLSGGLFKGVGEVTAYAIVEAFGEDTLKIIENSPARLAQVRGISLKKAMEINTSYNMLRGMQDAIIFLQELDISLNMAIKIYKRYEGDTIVIVKSNPYRLVEDIDGIGFLTADKIASGMGVSSDSRFRITAAIAHTLKEAVNKNGHTYLPKGALIAQTATLLKLNRDDESELIADVLEEMEVAGKLVSVELAEHTAVMLASYYLTEKQIAASIVRLSSAVVDDYSALSDISEYERVNNIVLHEGQKTAVQGCLSNRMSVVTGGPGTGKTTIIKCIISILKQRGQSFALCAPTGRASKRLSEATGEEAKTVHRMLDLSFGSGGVFSFGENYKVDADVVIVDEVSMCDEYVFGALLSSLKSKASLIMVGDKDQLPSVGAGNVLADVISSKAVPVYYLTQIYRQEEGSLIISNAHAINNGVMPTFDNKSKDFFFQQADDAQQITDYIIEMVTRRLPAYTGMEPIQIQVLCPMKKGIAGVENLNAALQDAVNPKTKDKRELKVGALVLRQGDKVIHTVNNYSLEWVDSDMSAGSGVYNGDIGYITDVNLTEPSVTVVFDDGRRAKYTQGILDQIRPAYAISVHKSQGCEFPVVALALQRGNYMIMTRNLLYTAVTRAKNMAVIVGAKDTIGNMVKNTYCVRRYSLLSDFIEQEYYRMHRQMP